MIKEHYEAIARRVHAACLRAGRPRESVTLIGVSKRHPASAIREACATTPLHDFGENYVQEYCDKRDTLADLGARWHFIGHLQRNKVRALLSRAPSLVHTVDSPELAETMERVMAEVRPQDVQPVLIEVRLGDDGTAKTGCPPDAIEALSEKIAHCRHLKLCGLMLIPPIESDLSRTRGWFRQTRALAASLSDRHDMSILSYGMSADFEAAIEEGATHIRVGTAIFGERDVHEP